MTVPSVPSLGPHGHDIIRRDNQDICEVRQKALSVSPLAEKYGVKIVDELDESRTAEKKAPKQKD
jgi:hypothetical protein